MLLPVTVSGMPAYPRIVYVDVKGAKVPVFLFGDETHKRVETIDGYTIRQNSDGVWCYAQKESDGSLQPTKWSIAEDYKNLPDLQRFLQTTPKHLEVTTPLYSHRNLSRINLKKERAEPVVGTRRVLVILMSFQDVRFTKTKEDFDALFNERGYKEDGAVGSVTDFYDVASYGQLQLACDIYGPYVAKNPMKYYGGNGKIGGDKAPEALFKEAIASVSNEADFSLYDSDNDGVVDNVHIIFAGYGEEAGANENAIWSHELTFQNSYEQYGTKFDRYSCAPELRGNRGNGISRIGPHCHEIGHALGAMDFYDTDYATGGEYSGTGKWDVMASGSWNEDGVRPANFNPYVKAYNYGWCNVQTLTDNSRVEIAPSFSDKTVYRVDTPHENEFFLIENRQQESFDSAIPGHGLLLFHIGGDIESRSQRNTINASYPQSCYIVCASSAYRLPSNNATSYGDINSEGCPFPGISQNDVFDYNSTPAALCNNGDNAGFSLSAITEKEDEIISFNIDFEHINMDDEDSVAIGEIVWQDTFDAASLSSFWNQEQVEGDGRWDVKQSGESSNRQNWLQLIPTFPPFDKKNIKVVTRLKSSLIEVGEEDEYILSLKVACQNNGSQGVDSILVYFYHDGEMLTEANISFPVVSETWSEHSVLIDRTMLPIEFAIDGICYRNSTLMIDDVTVRKKNATSSINGVKVVPAYSGLYTIGGVKLPPGKMSTIPGIYIKNGKKIIVR